MSEHREQVLRGPQQLHFMDDSVTPTLDSRASTSTNPQLAGHLVTNVSFTLQ